MRKLSYLVMMLLAIAARAEERNLWKQLFIPKEGVILETPEVTIEKPKEPLVERVPEHILNGNDRFLTLIY